MKTYRCKHAVEAMRWMDTPENHGTFTAWFGEHDAFFETRGSEVVLPEECGVSSVVSEGEWILFSHNEFIVMTDEQFHDEYAEEPLESKAPKPTVTPLG